MSRHVLALPCLLLLALAAATPIGGVPQAGTAPDQAQASQRLIAEGVELLRTDRADEAERRFAQATALAPSNPEAHYFLGVALERRKQFDQAVDAYRRAIALAPGMAEAHDRLGFMLGLQGQVDEAYASFERAVALNPALFDAQYHLGVTLWLRRDPQAALAPLQAAAKLQPRHAEAQLLPRADAARAGEAARGHRPFREGDDARADARRRVRAPGHCTARARRSGRGRASLRRALELEPGRFDALNALGLKLDAEWRRRRRRRDVQAAGRGASRTRRPRG